MKFRSVGLITGAVLVLGAFGRQAQQKWGLYPIGTPKSKYLWQTSRLAPGHGENASYDGRFTYARIAFVSSGSGFGGGGFGGGRGFDPKWDHDYPNSDRNFPLILSAISNLRTRTDGSVILRSDDPDLFKFPFAYMCEPGFWAPTEPEALGLRKWLMKGGFLLLDDFGPLNGRGSQDWDNFVVQLERVLPGAKLIPLDMKHPIYDAFYRITEIDHNASYRKNAEFYGVFEGNDPTRRMLMIVNYSYDISEFWEYSATGMFPVNVTNDAYKLGINYLFYAVTR